MGISSAEVVLLVVALLTLPPSRCLPRKGLTDAAKCSQGIWAVAAIGCSLGECENWVVRVKLYSIRNSKSSGWLSSTERTSTPVSICLWYIRCVRCGSSRSLVLSLSIIMGTLPHSAMWDWMRLYFLRLALRRKKRGDHAMSPPWSSPHRKIDVTTVEDVNCRQIVL